MMDELKEKEFEEIKEEPELSLAASLELSNGKGEDNE